jgi:hypothetical protein
MWKFARWHSTTEKLGNTKEAGEIYAVVAVICLRFVRLKAFGNARDLISPLLWRWEGQMRTEWEPASCWEWMTTKSVCHKPTLGFKNFPSIWLWDYDDDGEN